MTKSLFPECSSATFSECGRYRYLLTRRWANGPTINFLMLNPSTADEVDNDPTVERCQRRAARMGYGRLIVTNIFAFRATDPIDMKLYPDPVGPENDRYIRQVAEYMADLVVCAWGNHGSFMGRSDAVRRLLKDRELHVLKLSGTGQPCHPLYLPYSLKPVKWEVA